MIKLTLGFYIFSDDSVFTHHCVVVEVYFKKDSHERATSAISVSASRTQTSSAQVLASHPLLHRH